MTPSPTNRTDEVREVAKLLCKLGYIDKTECLIEDVEKAIAPLKFFTYTITLDLTAPRTLWFTHIGSVGWGMIDATRYFATTRVLRITLTVTDLTDELHGLILIPTPSPTMKPPTHKQTKRINNVIPSPPVVSVTFGISKYSRTKDFLSYPHRIVCISWR